MSVVGEGGLGNCMSLSVLSHESSVVRQTWQNVHFCVETWARQCYLVYELCH